MPFTNAEKYNLTKEFICNKKTWREIAQNYCKAKKLYRITNNPVKFKQFVQSMQRMGRRYILSHPEEFTVTEQQDGEDFEVEEILAHRKDSTGQTLYFVEWKNHVECTWEPESSFAQCQSIIRKYKKIIK